MLGGNSKRKGRRCHPHLPNQKKQKFGMGTRHTIKVQLVSPSRKSKALALTTQAKFRVKSLSKSDIRASQHHIKGCTQSVGFSAICISKPFLQPPWFFFLLLEICSCRTNISLIPFPPLPNLTNTPAPNFVKEKKRSRKENYLNRVFASYPSISTANAIVIISIEVKRKSRSRIVISVWVGREEWRGDLLKTLHQRRESLVQGICVTGQGSWKIYPSKEVR